MIPTTPSASKPKTQSGTTTLWFAKVWGEGGLRGRFISEQPSLLRGIFPTGDG